VTSESDQIENIKKKMIDGICHRNKDNYGGNNNNIQSIRNEPELSSVNYRIGTFTTFKQNMLYSISKQKYLSNLNTRSDKDFTIALFDAWANVLDVLTFYQERIINEGFLRTAKDRFSVLHLARPIGYELNQGQAATTFIAFNVVPTTPPSSPPSISTSASLTSATTTTGNTTSAAAAATSDTPIIIDRGIKIQSVPAQGEAPQIFETIERIEAYPEWNSLSPRLSWPQYIKNQISDSNTKSKRIYFAKKYPQLKEGTKLLLELREPTSANPNDTSGNTNTMCMTTLFFCLITKVETDKNTQLQYIELNEKQEYYHKICDQKCFKDDNTPNFLRKITGDEIVASTLSYIANAFGDKIDDVELKSTKKLDTK